MKSINPYNGQVLKSYEQHSAKEVNWFLEQGFQTWKEWRLTDFDLRGEILHKVAQVLRDRKEEYALLITREMGKLLKESMGEIEKCIWVCDYYANEAEHMLKDESAPSDASNSFVSFEPLGPILAVMPWNFPFWQVFRFAAPILMAGNSALLKHASNVTGCALAIEQIFLQAGAPQHLFQTLLVDHTQVGNIIKDSRVAAVTLTGSEPAGRSVAAAAGQALKKCVLELGGSDPFIVLADADLEQAAEMGALSRMITTGQTCISAKRFFVEESVADAFTAKLMDIFQALNLGDPEKETTTLAPMARPDLVAELHRQVMDSVAMGAHVVVGGKTIGTNGCFYAPTIIANVTPEMPVFKEETFGPVVALIKVKDAEEAISMANDSRFGLGASLWTSDSQMGESLARKVESGCVFVNGITKSDPRLPFGGIKASGFGRELAYFGIREFVNIKTIWVK